MGRVCLGRWCVSSGSFCELEPVAACVNVWLVLILCFLKTRDWAARCEKLISATTGSQLQVSPCPLKTIVIAIGLFGPSCAG